MIYYIGLGSNLGDRRKVIQQAIDEMIKNQCVLKKESSLYESPALLPKNGGSADWNKPFLNKAVEVDIDKNPEEVFRILKKIEKTLGRPDKEEIWAPRRIDLDILAYGGESYKTKNLEIPHKGASNRSFVLAPLRDICPSLKINSESVLSLNRKLKNPLPQWMDIVNLGPDSFSDGGEFKINEFRLYLDRIDNEGVQIIDLGAESTRPGATPVRPTEELELLEPALDVFNTFRKESKSKMLLSVDTRHFETAVSAVERGANYINDVSGLADERMLGVLKKSKVKYVLMHSLSVPANKGLVIPKELDVVKVLSSWLEQKLDLLEKTNIDFDRIVFDPGLGFGKTEEQSLEIVKRIKELNDIPIKILIGHSRKSFINVFSNKEAKEKDVESIGLSMKLAKAGVDILRVHKADLHLRAHKAWLHGS